MVFFPISVINITFISHTLLSANLSCEVCVRVGRYTHTHTHTPFKQDCVNTFCSPCNLKKMTGHAIYVETIQWLKIQSWVCLVVQRIPAWPLVREEPTGSQATKPGHNYWSTCALEPVLHKRRHCHEKFATTMKNRPCLLQSEKARMQQRRPSTAINNYINTSFKYI